MDIIERWQLTYKHGKRNRYPFDGVVSFVLRNYGNVPDRSGLRFLDLGCGGGNHTKFMRDEGFTCYAIDGSTESINITASFLGCEPTQENRLFVGNFKQLPFADGFFDLVVDRGSICCNPVADIRVILNQVIRVLKPGGRYYGVHFSARHPHLKYADSVSNNDFANFSGGMFEHSHLIHGFNKDEMLDVFSAFALEQVTQISKSNYLNQELCLEDLEVVACKPWPRHHNATTE